VPGDAEVCEHRFSELSRDGDAIDPRAVNRDRETVIAACEKVKGYVDTHTVHLIGVEPRFCDGVGSPRPVLARPI